MKAIDKSVPAYYAAGREYHRLREKSSFCRQRPERNHLGAEGAVLQRNAFSYSGVLRQNIGAKQGLRECDAESAGKGVVGDRS